MKNTKKTKKITRKGCRNVQLVWREDNYYEDDQFYGDGQWVVEKIHKDKPATFITKKICFEYNGLTGEKRRIQEVIKKFPHSEPFL